jgi:methionyl-tRNA formyltransferase
LNGETDVHFTLHVIDASIDAGDVLLQRSAPVGKAAPYPMDFMRTEIELAAGLFEELLKAVAMGTPLRRTAMEAWRGGTYFPRLLTEVHGVIDWSWPSIAIERTVRAFGWPYPGASTWVGEQRLALGRCSVADATAGFHPFMAGLIVNCWPDGTLEVVAGDGSVLVHTLRDGSAECPAASRLRLGMRLYTPVEALVKSRAFRARF